MANVVLTPGWDDIYKIEQTDPVLGGDQTNISNRQAVALGNRTEYLKEIAEDHETRIDTLETSSTNLNRMIGVGALMKQGIVTCAIDNNIFGCISVAKITTSPILNRVTLTANTTSPLIIAFSGGYDANGPIVYYGRVTSNQVVNVGNNSAGLLYAEYNPTTGAMTFGVTNATTSHVVSYSDPGTTGYWYSLKDEKLYLWNGSAWENVIQVVLGSISWSGSGSFAYFQPIGRGIKDVFGRSAVPAGSVSAFAGASAPFGYVICDGSALSRAVYSDLFSAIGTTYGVGDGSSTFNIPDLRGEFIRGLDGGRGIDLNSVVKLASTTNGSANVTVTTTEDLYVGMTVSGTGIPVGATILSITSSSVFVLSANATATNPIVALTLDGRFLGSYQADMLKSHFHIMKKYNRQLGSGEGFFAMNDNGTDGSENTESTGGVETRPRNIAMNYIIKF